MTTGTQVPAGATRIYEPYRVSVQEYVTFREQGFLLVRGLVPQNDTEEMLEHMDNLLAGRESIPGVESPPADWSPEQKLGYWQRVHMLHHVLPMHERFLLHPRVLDVLEALIGPDVSALQSMLFFKQAGQPGQGYHQDSYYIPTQPDTLCGAWMALERADEENGCLWMTVGSQHEPIYPDCDGVTPNGQRDLKDIESVYNVSHTDENANGLTKVARKYPGREVKAEVDAGDVLFFGGHILHRSHTNRSQARSRRSFVGHYCNARSWIPWGGGNEKHILARGSTHLPYAQPVCGTPCAANQPVRVPEVPHITRSPMGDENGYMILTPHSQAEHED